eukprot:jgi/Bigna1/146020/aug1.107_g20728
MAKTAAAAIQSSAISPPAIVDAATGISRHAASKPSYLFQALVTPSKRGDPRYTFECSVFKVHNDHGFGDNNIICSERRGRKGSCNDDDSKKVDDDSTNGIKKGKSDDDILASATLAIEPKFIHQCGSVGHVINIYIREGGGRGTVSVKEQRSLGCYKCLIDANESLAKELKDLVLAPVVAPTIGAGVLTTMIKIKGRRGEDNDEAEEDEKQKTVAAPSSSIVPSSSSSSPSSSPTTATTTTTTTAVPSVMMKTKPIFSCHRITSDDFDKGFLELLAQLTVVGVISSKLFQDQLKAIDNEDSKQASGQIITKNYCRVDYKFSYRAIQLGCEASSNRKDYICIDSTTVPEWPKLVATGTLLVLKHRRRRRRRRRRRSRQGSSAATTSSDLKTKEAAEQKDGDDNNNYSDKKRNSYQENDNNEDYNEDDDIDQEEIINVGHIEDVVVDRQIRGQGLGKFILSSILSLALDKNCQCCILNCDRKNIPFYKKCGFEEKLIGMAHYF